MRVPAIASDSDVLAKRAGSEECLTLVVRRSVPGKEGRLLPWAGVQDARKTKAREGLDSNQHSPTASFSRATGRDSSVAPFSPTAQRCELASLPLLPTSTSQRPLTSSVQCVTPAEGDRTPRGRQNSVFDCVDGCLDRSETCLFVCSGRLPFSRGQ